MNLTTLPPGTCSALSHRHSHPQKFIHILSNTPALRIDTGSIPLRPDMCAGFVPGGPAHQSVPLSDADIGWAERAPTDARRSRFVTGRPPNGNPAGSENDGGIILQSPDRATVDAAFAPALRGGGQSEGDPGVRLHCHRNFHGACLRDPDGKKLRICCRKAPIVDGGHDNEMTAVSGRV